jgi:hypothetical protein
MKLAKKGRPRIEDRARTIEAKKPWLKLEMSRRTWYRRQAEKRAATLRALPLNRPARSKLLAVDAAPYRPGFLPGARWRSAYAPSSQGSVRPSRLP